MRALYLLGAPGVGKTTVMDAYLLRCGWTPLPDADRLHGLLWGHAMIDPDGDPRGIYLGRRRDAFSGTDALGMAVAPDARAWARSLNDASTTLFICGEGNRLGNRGFLRALAEVSDLTVALLTGSPETLAQRRGSRPGTQDDKWRKGATSAARNAYESSDGYAEHLLVIDTDGLSPVAVASLL